MGSSVQVINIEYFSPTNSCQGQSKGDNLLKRINAQDLAITSQSMQQESNEKSIEIVNIEKCENTRKNQQVLENTEKLHGCKSFWNLFKIFVIFAACILNISLLTMIPRSYTIRSSDYWYEGLVLVIASCSVRNAFDHILELFIFTRSKVLVSFSHFAKVLLVHSITYGVPYCSYVLWTWHVRNTHPTQFMPLAYILANMAIYIIAFWFLFPTKLRKQEKLKIQAKVYIQYRFWEQFQTVTTQILGSAATHIPQNLQWILGLLIPLARVVSCNVAKKIVEAKPETNNNSVKHLVTAHLTIYYVLYVTTRLPTLSQNTIYTLLVFELILHLIACYEIVKSNAAIGGESQESENETVISARKMKVLTLVMNEFVEAMIPIIYGIAIAMAYFGPNAALMKNAGSNIFGGNDIDAIKHIYIVMLQMCSVDILAMIISAISLHSFARLNLFQEFCNMMEKYWMIFLVKLPNIAMHLLIATTKMRQVIEFPQT